MISLELRVAILRKLMHELQVTLYEFQFKSIKLRVA